MSDVSLVTQSILRSSTRFQNLLPTLQTAPSLEFKAGRSGEKQHVSFVPVSCGCFCPACQERPDYVRLGMYRMHDTIADALQMQATVITLTCTNNVDQCLHVCSFNGGLSNVVLRHDLAEKPPPMSEVPHKDMLRAMKIS